MRKDQFLILLDKYIGNSATDEEKLLVENYYDALDNFERYDLKIENELQIKELIFSRLRARIDNKEQQKNKPAIKKLNYRWISIAALLALVFSAGLFFIKESKNKPKPIDYANLIKAGGNNAILTLSNGKKVVLNTKQIKKSINDEGNVTVININDGILEYAKNNSNNPNSDVEIFNTVETPRGGKYKVVLNDGTIVWLNASSKLKFPVEFKGALRKVELLGEGYFEVAHNPKMPFIVSTKTQNVEVLGTHFNVNAYEDEPSVKTTLVQGKVKVSSKLSGKFGYLKPGNQAEFYANDFKIRDVDLRFATDWKEDKFLFKDEDINSIMRKISRWYNVEVEFPKPIEGITFSGKISRTKNLKEFIKILSLTNDIKFNVKERRVTVTQ